ncbi:hypothetical protein GCM10010199_09170 [Dactylosporangium roseum]
MDRVPQRERLQAELCNRLTTEAYRAGPGWTGNRRPHSQQRCNGSTATRDRSDTITLRLIAAESAMASDPRECIDDSWPAVAASPGPLDEVIDRQRVAIREGHVSP